MRYARTILDEVVEDPYTLIDAVYEADSVDPRHAHSLAHLSLVIDGAVLEDANGNPERYGPGTVRAQDPGARHALYFPQESRIVTVIVPTLGADAAGGTTMGSDFTIAARIHRGRVGDIGRLAAAMLDALHARRRPAPPVWLASALETFPWSSDVPIISACGTAGVHRSHFGRAFRAYLGVSPRTYRRMAKVRQASRLLLDSDATLAEVAYAAGFSGQSHMTAAFASTFGLSPGRFRQAFMQTA